jgi:hypothetical protein
VPPQAIGPKAAVIECQFQLECDKQMAITTLRTAKVVVAQDVTIPQAARTSAISD